MVERKVVEFENLAECSSCGTQGAFDLGATYLCAECLVGPEDAEAVKQERDFLRDENAKLQRMVKTRENKVKHLQGQLSTNKLRRRLEQQGETVRAQGERIGQLKREKAALHEYMDRHVKNNERLQEIERAAIEHLEGDAEGWDRLQELLSGKTV